MSSRSYDPIADVLSSYLPDDASGSPAFRGLDTGLLKRYGTLLCCHPDFTIGAMLEAAPALKHDWAQQLERGGIHCTEDAIEVHFNPAGGFDDDEHRAHPHLGLTTFGAPSHG